VCSSWLRRRHAFIMSPMPDDRTTSGPHLRRARALPRCPWVQLLPTVVGMGRGVREGVGRGEGEGRVIDAL